MITQYSVLRKKAEDIERSVIYSEEELEELLTHKCSYIWRVPERELMRVGMLSSCGCDRRAIGFSLTSGLVGSYPIHSLYADMQIESKVLYVIPEGCPGTLGKLIKMLYA